MCLAWKKERYPEGEGPALVPWTRGKTVGTGKKTKW